MDLIPIKTEADYNTALAEIDRLFDAAPDTMEGDRLELLTALVMAYEEKRFSIPLPDPIEAILYHPESRGMEFRDLELVTKESLSPYIGPHILKEVESVRITS